MTRGFAAVKTGTSKDMRDNWCIGFTDRYTIGVWIGNAGGEAMHDVSGVSGAAPIWQALVRHLHANSPSRSPAAPPGVVRARAEFESALEPPRPEVFIAGTEASRKRERSAAAARVALSESRVRSTGASSRSIPTCRRPRRRSPSKASTAPGCSTASGWEQDASLRWAPWPGRHELTLVSANGKRVQSVRFEVRGAGVKAAASNSYERRRAAGSKVHVLTRAPTVRGAAPAP